MSTANEITDWLAERETDMVALLEALVNTDGGSYDKAGVDAVGEEIRTFLEGEGIPVETIPIETHGDALDPREWERAVDEFRRALEHARQNPIGG